MHKLIKSSANRAVGRRRFQRLGLGALLLALTLSVAAFSPRLHAQAADDLQLSEQSKAQFEAVRKVRDARTPDQKKISTQFFLAQREALYGVAVAGAPKLRSTARAEADGRYKVRITAAVTPELLDAIKTLGGQVLSSFPKYGVVYAFMPLVTMETLAARPDVQFIGRPSGFRHNDETPQALRAAPAASSGRTAGRRPAEVDTSVNDPEGDATTGAAQVRTALGATGAGIKVGVLSNGIDNGQGVYQAAISAGDVPDNITILSGQAGAADSDAEGLAMLEIVHRIAPGATLYFATGDGSPEQFAENIQTMANDGCKVIIDDVSYLGEAVYQDGVIAQAVDAVSAQGVLYFSSASNRGNYDRMTSSTWQGDFNSPYDDGYLDFTGNISGATSLERDHYTSPSSANTVCLFWAEPLNGATSQYDLLAYDGFDLVATGDDDVASTKTPAQALENLAAGDSIAVRLESGNAVNLHIALETDNAYFYAYTNEATYGHNACGATYAFCVAATPAAAPEVSGNPSGPYPGMFTSSDDVEPFSSDGPRRIFFNPDGSAITPGVFTSAGGVNLSKPDFTAADGVSTSVPNIGSGTPFYGTSAAAPHASAIAALLLSYYPDIGSHLTHLKSVVFSGNATATGATVTDTRIATTVPSGAQTGTFQVATTAGSATSATKFTVAGPQVPTITSTLAAAATEGKAFTYQITAANEPTSYAASGLPTGLSVNTSTGLITGTPKNVGKAAITISAINANGTGTARVTITIAAP